MDESTKPDRRSGARVQRIQLCSYQLSHVAGQKVLKFSDGHALSLNAGPGGYLLLMPQPPERRQVFEVHTPLETEEQSTTKLVEACWTREMIFGPARKVYLVGVRSLFEPTPVH